MPNVFLKNDHYFWYGSKPLPKISNIKEEHFGFLNAIYLSWTYLDFKVLGFDHPHFKFLRNLNMMQDDDAKTSKANARAVTAI